MKPRSLHTNNVWISMEAMMGAAAAISHDLLAIWEWNFI